MFNILGWILSIIVGGPLCALMIAALYCIVVGIVSFWAGLFWWIYISIKKRQLWIDPVFFMKEVANRFVIFKK